MPTLGPIFIPAGRTILRAARSVVAMQVTSTWEPPGIQLTKTVAQAGSVAVLEELVVDAVGRIKIFVLVEEDVAHDDVAEVKPGLLERRLDVSHRLANLLLERGGVAAAGKLVALARDIERVARQDPGAVWEAGRRCADGFFLRRGRCTRCR